MARRAKRTITDSALDHVFFVLGGTATVWLAYLLVGESFHLGWGQLWFPLVFWAFVAYLLLPRLHRILTAIYVPGYFIGRARTSDGLLGDPVNLALLGSESQVHAAMGSAGWTMADDLTFSSGRRIAESTILRRSYPEAPVSPLSLFGRQQDFAYQQEVDNSPGKRHHVRFWRCPEGWMLPGGRTVDWLAAGTYDRSVGFSLFTLQITHKIERNTDVERDHIVRSVSAAEPLVSVGVIKDFSTGYHSRNGGGDSISTDGDLPIIDVRRIPATIRPSGPGAARRRGDFRPHCGRRPPGRGQGCGRPASGPEAAGRLHAVRPRDDRRGARGTRSSPRPRWPSLPPWSCCSAWANWSWRGASLPAGTGRASLPCGSAPCRSSSRRSMSPLASRGSPWRLA